MATHAFAPVCPDGLTFQLVDPLDDADWNAKLTAGPSASFFHTAAWAQVLRDTYGFKPLYFTLRDRRQVHALLPMMEVDSWLTGRRGISLPFTDECAPLCPDDASFQSLFLEVQACAKRRGWKYVECRGGRPLFGESLASSSYFGHRLDLHREESALWAQFDDSTRRAVRKAEQSNLTVEFSQDLDALRIFYRLLGQTRRRHGMPPQPFRFFKYIHQHVLAQNQGQVVLVRSGRRPVAGAVFFHFGRTALFKFGASDAAFHRLRVNNLVMWQAIKWHARHDFSALDFGRTSFENEGLRKFKLGWGPEEHRIDYVRYDCRSGGFVQAPDRSSGWHNHIFRRLPGGLARLIGTALYKHIA
ncbi:MAG: GNAT family N-acetyltransferase [Opitutaceae bacterium]|jgi:hypothetical protein